MDKRDEHRRIMNIVYQQIFWDELPTWIGMVVVELILLLCFLFSGRAPREDKTDSRTGHLELRSPF